MKRFLLLLSITTTMMCCTCSLQAQQNKMHKKDDTSFVRKNIKDNMMEIRLSQMALEKSSKQEIKDLAQQMVTDHQQILSELKSIPGLSEGMMSDSTGEMMNDSTGGMMNDRMEMENRNMENDSSHMPSQSDIRNDTMSWKNDTANRHNKNWSQTGGNKYDKQGMHKKMEALQSATGAEFDRMWVSEMLSMHEKKLSELQTASASIKNAELKSSIVKAIPKIRSHRDKLAQLNKK